jgi:hypothetical protein
MDPSTCCCQCNYKPMYCDILTNCSSLVAQPKKQGFGSVRKPGDRGRIWRFIFNKTANSWSKQFSNSIQIRHYDAKHLHAGSVVVSRHIAVTDRPFLWRGPDPSEPRARSTAGWVIGMRLGTVECAL